MSSKAEQLYRLICQVRACFQALKVMADDMHADLGITASMRAVLEAVCDTPRQTVPEIARAKGVSRQHIQVNVDALLAQSLVAVTANPSHARSAHIVPTPAGRKAFAQIRKREQLALDRMATGLSMSALIDASRTLNAVSDHCRNNQPQGGEYDGTNET